MKNVAKKPTRRQEAPATRESAPTQLPLALAAVREELLAVVTTLGTSVFAAMLEDERTRLCGPRYMHDADREAMRAGYTRGDLALGGRRVSLPRPRVRSRDGHEVALETWTQFAERDALTPRAVEQMVLGVSTRKYKRSLDTVPSSMTTRGTSKSAVSRRFVAGTTRELDKLRRADLSKLALCAVMIDGIHVGEHLVLVALGIDEVGEKHVLGLREGATENTVVCKAFIGDLIARGLSDERAMLFVIDGGKGIAAAIRAHFGDLALIQRCQVHKKRNVEGHLPESMRNNVGRKISEAYGMRDVARAKRVLEGIANQVEKDYPSAAASMREGLDETLTVLHFGVGDALTRTLATTNPIEFINGRLRKTSANVDRWRNGTMVLRWMAIGLVEAARTFRKLRGHKQMPKLVAALRAHDAKVNPSAVDVRNKAA
jgi:putative transposase